MAVSSRSLLSEIDDQIRLYFRRMVTLSDLEGWLERALCEPVCEGDEAGQKAIARVVHLLHVFREGGEIPNEDILRGMLVEAVQSLATPR